MIMRKGRLRVAPDFTLSQRGEHIEFNLSQRGEQVEFNPRMRMVCRIKHLPFDLSHGNLLQRF
jgi:hypothetical protein